MQKLKTYLAIVAVLFSMNSCVINDLNGQANIVIDQAEKKFDNIASIVVKGSFCKVNINSHSASNIEFKGELKANKERDDVTIEYKQNGSTLEVWIERPNSLRGSFNGFLNFKVPANTNIDVRNSSGSVNVTNIDQSIVKLVASSGSIYAENINSDLKATASSGSIKALNISGNLISTCSSGSIKMENIKGNLISSTSSGSQYIKMISSEVKSTSSSGSLNISNVKGNVSARASSGTIKLNNIKGALKLNTSSGGQYGEEIHLTGNSYFNSSSGSIKIGISNTAEELSFNLTASSGSLQAKGSNGKKKLKIEKGDILIKGVSSSGSQKYY